MDINNTLNKDIQLVEKENGYWDFEFQYGDYVLAENKKSLRSALIIACLTSWNYMNRQGNPTYSTFGNRAYQELKKKKSPIVEYAIKQYFLEVLNNIRRVHRVVNLEIRDTPSDPNAYDVLFTVEANNDELVRGQFSINTEKTLSPTFMTVSQSVVISSPTNPSVFNVKINTEYDEYLTDEIIYAYKVLSDGTEEFLKAYKLNENILIYPFDKFGYEKVKFKFKGNELFNPCESETFEILSIPFFFKLDGDDNLKVIKTKDYGVTIWIGEVVENEQEMEYDGNPNKCYIIPIQGTDDYSKYTYYDNEWNTNSENVYHIINKGVYGEVELGDRRLFVEDLNKDLYIIGRLNRTTDGHIEIAL